MMTTGFPSYVRGAWRAFIWPFGEPWWMRSIRIVYWLGVIAVAAMFHLIIPVIVFWVVPAVTLLPVIRYFGELSEHAAAGCASEVVSSRNNLGWLQEWTIHPHGDGYHIIHHLYPKTPHHPLARAHRTLLAYPLYRYGGRHCYGIRATLADLVQSPDPAGAGGKDVSS